MHTTLQAYLLARTHKSITMLQITFRTGSAVGDVTFAARCVASVDTRMTGGDKFLHFAVNPWNGGQIAVFDVKGRWSLWNFALKNTLRTSIVFTPPNMSASGAIFDEDTIVSWANLVWGNSPTELVIATRKELIRVNIQVSALLSL